MPHDYHFNFDDDTHIFLQRIKAKKLLESSLEINEKDIVATIIREKHDEIFQDEVHTQSC